MDKLEPAASNIINLKSKVKRVVLSTSLGSSVILTLILKASISSGSQYFSHLEHNFNGRLFSRIPWLRKLNLREIVSVRGVWGDLSDANIALSEPANIPLIAPNKEPYWEYSFGVGNIFKIFRLDFNFRGNYLDNPKARKFGVTGTFGFHF